MYRGRSESRQRRKIKTVAERFLSAWHKTSAGTPGREKRGGGEGFFMASVLKERSVEPYKNGSCGHKPGHQIILSTRIINFTRNSWTTNKIMSSKVLV
jgi:hypothetical protein